MKPMDDAMVEAEKPNISVGPEDDPALQACRQMFISHTKFQRRLEQLTTPKGLNLSQFEALAKVGLRPGMIQQDLAEILLLTKGNIGAMIDRLEGLALIERRPDASDKRLNRLYLTGSGKELVSELFQEHLTLVRDMMRPLTTAQQRQLRNLLRMLDVD
jgi:DNA-binding MarR family transcriptional regulator